MDPARRTPGRGASTEEIAAFVGSIRADPARREELLPLLREEAAVYVGRSSGEAARLRGFILASFAETGLPDAALDYVLEELETGWHPYAVAAAARVLRDTATFPEGTVALIRSALRRIRAVDDHVDFSELAPAARPAGNTAMAELGEALASAERSTGCCGNRAATAAPAAAEPQRLRDLVLEDQDGARLTFAELTGGRAALLSFFYTRCMNPQKCSLTVTRLARVWRMAQSAGLADRIVVAGITYDPEFDLPFRLRDYGEGRGMHFAPNCRLLRTIGEFETLRAQLSLGVGYGDATVNQHRLEAIVLDRGGRIAEFRTRRLWDEAEMFGRLSEQA